LACAPKDIQLGLLCQQLESHCLVECFSDEKKCVIFSKCLFKNVLKEALDAFIQTLSRYTLEDLVDRQKNWDF
jgi:Rrf2 family nitric oxide-sensitive transcriptional repressor